MRSDESKVGIGRVVCVGGVVSSERNTRYRACGGSDNFGGRFFRCVLAQTTDDVSRALFARAQVLGLCSFGSVSTAPPLAGYRIG